MDNLLNLLNKGILSTANYKINLGFEEVNSLKLKETV